MTTEYRSDTPATVTFPEVLEPHPENSFAALFSHSLLQTRRLLLRWARDPYTMLQAIVYPSLMLLMFWAVLGISITKATGVNSVYGTVPMITLVGAMFGSIAGGLSLKKEWADGLLSRFWVLPVHRASGLLSRLMAESVRIVLTTVLIIAVGFAIGFRFDQGILAGIALMLLPLLFGVSFATMVTALAVNAAKAPLVELLSLLCTLLLFFNSGFVPTGAYPTWLQPFVENQPMSCAIDAMKGLSMGGPVAEPLLKTVAWSLAGLLIFTYPAVRGYRRAAGNPA
ncbi:MULTISPECIES: ABC transporter permease [Rhodococcus]|uniref:Transport permease protein n=1 Tax=Rhodococcus opacus TaxID=37919 RepID=A0A076EI16_RHOOP|nr:MULTISPECIES: ABC transporter permease [Rhodococcus]AII04917.1 peptide ABC transporter permease [Rhodococcus opacus]WAM16160.1 ABC transporter permease [Rhodococcus sp. JS3073]